jgi:hypothetical protein
MSQEQRGLSGQRSEEQRSLTNRGRNLSRSGGGSGGGRERLVALCSAHQRPDSEVAFAPSPGRAGPVCPAGRWFYHPKSSKLWPREAYRSKSFFHLNLSDKFKYFQFIFLKNRPFQFFLKKISPLTRPFIGRQEMNPQIGSAPP